MHCVPTKDFPDDSAWTEDAETAALLLSKPTRATVLAFLNSPEARSGVTKAAIEQATGVSSSTVRVVLEAAEKRELLFVEPQRKASGGHLYRLDQEKYRQAVKAWMNYALGKDDAL